MGIQSCQYLCVCEKPETGNLQLEYIFISSVTTDTHLSPLVLVQNSEDLLQFPLILILLHLCSYQLAEFIKFNVAKTYRFVHKQGWDWLVVQRRWWINQYGLGEEHSMT